MYYGVFSAIVDVTNGGCGWNIGNEKGFNVGINIRLCKNPTNPPQRNRQWHALEPFRSARGPCALSL
jgi:hypothetical protein